MSISVFDLFSIGIGPSSSHTVGPMRAALRYIEEVKSLGKLNDVAQIKIDLYGSLALTGKGHGTDLAVMLALEGETPENVIPEEVQTKIQKIRETLKLNLLNTKEISFNEVNDLIFHKDKFLPFHPNAVRFQSYNLKDELILSKVYYSVGGGFIVEHEQTIQQNPSLKEEHSVPNLFSTSQELLNFCTSKNLTIQEVMMENEMTFRTREEVECKILKIWKIMDQCIDRGCSKNGILPGGLNVKRRAKLIMDQLLAKREIDVTDFMQWVSLWALAVNEENAAGGRVVTAPTNGSAGVIPAVVKYYTRFCKNSNDSGIITFFLVAAAIGILYKKGASISAAEMGCMGEIGVASSMAAAGLTAALGGTLMQIENAAEIAMEHHLGLTCDPVKGLVQIPCIERNTMGALKAINASLLALAGDGTHYVSLDHVIATMKQTGQDMKSIYKETSLGGLAVNVPEC